MVRVRLPFGPNGHEYDEFRDDHFFEVKKGELGIYPQAESLHPVAEYAKGAWVAAFLVTPDEQANSN